MMNDNDRLIQAARDVADSLTEAFLDNATRFTCSESETLAEFFRATGNEDTAEEFIRRHAEDDDEGDDHHYNEES